MSRKKIFIIIFFYNHSFYNNFFIIFFFYNNFSSMAASWMAAPNPSLCKTPLGETGSLCIFFWPWPHITGTPPWLLRPVRVSTSSELYPNTWLFFECLGIHFFTSLTCGLLDTMPCQTSLTLIPREAEDFPKGDNHSKHVALPTYLA